MAASMKCTLHFNIFNKLQVNNYRQVIPRIYYGTETKYKQSELVKEVRYPDVIGEYPPGNWGSFKAWASWKTYERSKQLNEIPTAKERLQDLAGNTEFYMTKCMANDNRPNTLLYKRYITKTWIEKGLPEVYDKLNVQNDVDYVKDNVQDAILFHNEHSNFYINENQNPKTRTMNDTHFYLQKLILSIMSGLNLRYDHLINSQMDERVRLETFWRRGGYLDAENQLLPIRGNWNGVITLQLKDEINWQIRTELPLPEFIPREADVSKGTSVSCNMVPNGYGQPQIRERPISISGHWIGDPCEWGLLSFYTARHLDKGIQDDHGAKVFSSHLHDLAVVAGFGSCVAQAHNQGFNSYLELTYPITTQTITYGSNGEFYICAYQLNTIELHKDDLANPYQNIAWVSGPHKLYDTIENGQVKGFNNDTLELLVKCFAMKPVDRGIDLRPYLPNEEAPIKKKVLINQKGEPVPIHPPVGRYQYPKNSLYFE